MIKNKLFAARKEKYMTQNEIAGLLGMSQSQYQRRESGEIRISDSEWTRMARVLNKDIKDIKEDIHILNDKNKLNNVHCIGTPDLIVNIQSQTKTKHNMPDMFDSYEQAGVKEYWTINPSNKNLIVFTLQENGKYDNGTTYELPGKVHFGIFKGLEIDLKELFVN